ncbi:single-stranded-DNA-specific exonuclease RecJ [Bacillus salipaludis]|uniref:Single-stranded-DNA-specific exonuclease RecJ n=1 Tax=Bacillus salipaludis TaxID=2547811 RepID=A0AA90TP33_9BACI|nr:single-stranded-DNA-specific exonuclease RecJ [Bacillus salipaludis]MDQ6596386.1 single-stranded-DNA-specific exonuclease RecJ [Bacillus salipaludis]
MHWKPIDIPYESHPKRGYFYYCSRMFDLDPRLIHYLWLNGYKKEEQMINFLVPNIDKMYSPFLLNDMNLAVQRIIKALYQKEHIFIFGDYDTDGITSTTLLYKILVHLNGKVSFRLPLRKEGYGLTANAVFELPTDVSLLITEDNGSSAHEAMKVAKQRGVEVIVTDHHEVLGPHPSCYAFINPRRVDNTYPFPSLSGAGVALKVSQALYERIGRRTDAVMSEAIELATLGTIADLMMVDENRIICSLGLRKLENHPIPLIKHLKDLLHISKVDSSTVGFTFGPIFNACGRISDPNIAVKLLLMKNLTKEMVNKVIYLNEKRKEMTQLSFKIALDTIEENQLHKDQVIVVNGSFHHGIIGILAGKIVETFRKPTIVISKDGVGSARSVNGTDFSIVSAIKECGDHLLKFGGHQAAAGFSITPDSNKIGEFRKVIQEIAKKQEIRDPLITYCFELSINDVTDTFLNDLYSLEPFGINFPKPIFFTSLNDITHYETFGRKQNHLKLFHSKKEIIGFDIANNFAQWKKSSKLEVLYTSHCMKRKNILLKNLRIKE